MYDKSQLMRGIMEGCILSIIGRERTYGYGIVEQLRENGFSEVKEGTIYPLLLRLEKRNDRGRVFSLTYGSSQKILQSYV